MLLTQGNHQMAIEIEKKFLVIGTPWEGLKGTDLQQCYLSRENVTVRVRTSNQKAWLTVKGKPSGISRSEFEYEIPLQDAHDMLNEFCGDRRIVKTRYRIPYEGFTWEVDVFAGANKGLIIAEIELPSAKISPPLPDWVGEEVSDDRRYSNSMLLSNPWPFL
jgi:adenylate cyclase